MKQELDCQIVQDLMRSYIDDVLNEYTRDQIEEHLSHCKDCAETFNKMKHYDKLRNDDIEYMRIYQRKLKRYTTISVISLLVLISIVLYLFIPRKITLDGTYTEYQASNRAELIDAKIKYSYSPGMELFNKFYLKLEVTDLYDDVLIKEEVKNWYIFKGSEYDLTFDQTSFFYYDSDLNEQVRADLYVDAAKENIYIICDSFEIKACDDDFLEKVLDFKNRSKNE